MLSDKFKSGRDGFLQRELLFILLAVFAVSLGSCDPDAGEGGYVTYPPDCLFIYSMKDAEKKIPAHPYGDSPERAIYLEVCMDMGDTSQPDNNYLRLLEVIGKSGKYVWLAFGGAAGGETVFTSPPLNEAAKGMDKIIGTSFPNNTKSIEADTNGVSPLFFYENLKWVVGNKGLTEISASAFRSCKGIERAEYLPAKIIGEDAFRGCENLKTVDVFSVETIGDNAFFNCSSLEYITFLGAPPKLGSGVFLGSTPSNFTIIRMKESVYLYTKWLSDNASNFNNGGKDIVFKDWVQ